MLDPLFMENPLVSPNLIILNLCIGKNLINRILAGNLETETTAILVLDIVTSPSLNFNT